MKNVHWVVLFLVVVMSSCTYPLHNSLKEENIQFRPPNLSIKPIATPIELKYRPHVRSLRSVSVIQTGNSKAISAEANMSYKIEVDGTDLVWNMIFSDLFFDGEPIVSSSLPIALMRLKTTDLGRVIEYNVSFPALDGMKGENMDEFKEAVQKLPLQFIKEIPAEAKSEDTFYSIELTLLTDEMKKNLEKKNLTLIGQCVNGVSIKSVAKGLANYNNSEVLILESDGSCLADVTDTKGHVEPLIFRWRGFSGLDRKSLSPVFGKSLFTIRAIRDNSNVDSMFMEIESK